MADGLPDDYEPPTWATVSLTVWGEDWQVEVDTVRAEHVKGTIAYYRRLMAPPPKPKQPRKKAR